MFAIGLSETKCLQGIAVKTIFTNCHVSWDTLLLKMIKLLIKVMDDLRTGIGFEDGSRLEVEDGSSYIFEDVSRDGFSLEYPSLLRVYSE